MSESRRRELHQRREELREQWGPITADRLLAFSDGVFAIAVTLLALDIRVPPDLSDAEFTRALRDALPGIGAYALSFVIIGRLWLFHHRIFTVIARVDSAVLVRNLVLLGVIAIMPFPVRLLSDYHDQPAAMAIYAGMVTMATVVQATLWAYVVKRERLLIRLVPEELRRNVLQALVGMSVTLGLGVPLAVLSPRIAILVWLGLLLVAAILSRFLGRRAQG
jgi:uncharacterized membrane protein